MTKPKLVTAITIAIVLALVIPTACAATITVSTSKTAYAPGDTLTISGTVSPVTTGQDVAIQVFGPVGELKSVGQATPAADGKYTANVMIFKPGDPSGSWSVKVTYAGTSAATSFTYAGVPPVTEIALKIAVDVGSVFIPGDSAAFYVLTSYDTTPIDANITATIYPTLPTPTVAKVATGLQRVTYSIPANATTGTYTVVINATVATAEFKGSAIALKSVEVATLATKADVTALDTAVKGAKAAADAASAAVGGLTSAVWAAVILSLIAAIAAVYSTITVQRKIVS